jgi:hypothetical protein
MIKFCIFPPFLLVARDAMQQEKGLGTGLKFIEAVTGESGNSSKLSKLLNRERAWAHPSRARRRILTTGLKKALAQSSRVRRAAPSGEKAPTEEDLSVA